LESIVKNCGGAIHKEVSQRDMVDALRELAKVKYFIIIKKMNKFFVFKNGPDVIRDKVLELIQCWSHGLGILNRNSFNNY